MGRMVAVLVPHIVLPVQHVSIVTIVTVEEVVVCVVLIEVIPQNQNLEVHILPLRKDTQNHIVHLLGVVQVPVYKKPSTITIHMMQSLD